MKILVKRPDETAEIPTEERCHILELLNESDDLSQSIARARVEPGVTTAWHQLKDTSEVYVLLSGSGTVELNENESHELAAGELVRIPPNTPQRITNTGVDDLIFLCFCTPAFGDHCYEALE